MMSKVSNRFGFTLMELIVVIVIMGIIASVALRSIDNAMETTRVQSTKQEMQELSYAIAGNPNLYANGMRSDFGYVGDVGSLPPDLDALVSNPGGYSTWNGPYISASFAEAGDEFKRDSWGHVYSYAGVTLQSNGGGGTLTKDIAGSAADLTANTVTGNVIDGAGNPPGDSATQVSVILSYPDGSGGIVDAAGGVAASGAFSYSGTVPIGNHLLRCIYAPTGDTVISYLSVLPGGTSFATLKLPGAIWAATAP